MTKGTNLYHRIMEYKTSDRDKLSAEIWAAHPWMVNMNFGSPADDIWYEGVTWLRDNLGKQTWPFGQDKWEPLRYFISGATINGWTWIGFRDKADYDLFVEEWKEFVEPEPADD